MDAIRVHALINELGFGGAETMLVDLAAGAPELGLELAVSYLHAGESQATAERLRAQGVDPVLIPFRRLANVAGHRAVRARFAATRPDVIHTHLRTADIVGGLAARSLGVPALCTLHGFDWDPGVTGLRSARGRAGSALATLARRRLTRRVVAPSDALARGWLEHAGDEPGHVVTIHSASSRAPRPGAGAAARAGLGVAPEEFVVLMLSWLHPLKGHAAAIQAAGRLAAGGEAVRLVVVGPGPEEERLRALARDTAPDTAFTGYRDDVMELLDAADLLLHPSRMEGLPITLLEAMAAGVPIVATRVGGIPELVEDGVSGVLLDAPASPVAIAAAIVRVRADAEVRGRLARVARDRFEERFSAGAWGRRMRDLYAAEVASAA
jgi:glycosyltransferase involved in cell wall biosynthesis